MDPSTGFQTASMGSHARTKVRMVATMKRTQKAIMAFRNQLVFLPLTKRLRKKAIEILTVLMPVLSMGDWMKAQKASCSCQSAGISAKCLPPPHWTNLTKQA